MIRNEYETDPTTQEHERMSNKLMLDLGFEWNDDKQRWYPQFNFLVQGEVTAAIKKLLDNNNRKDK